MPRRGLVALDGVVDIDDGFVVRLLDRFSKHLFRDVDGDDRRGTTLTREAREIAKPASQIEDMTSYERGELPAQAGTSSAPLRPVSFFRSALYPSKNTGSS